MKKKKKLAFTFAVVIDSPIDLFQISSNRDFWAGEFFWAVDGVAWEVRHLCEPLRSPNELLGGRKGVSWWPNLQKSDKMTDTTFFLILASELLP